MEIEKLIRRKQVIEMTGLSYSSIYRAEKAGRFPKRVRIGMNSVAWKLSEIQAWIRDRENVIYEDDGFVEMNADVQ